MRDDYLWDGSGEPDPEIQKLQTALGKFRHSRPAPRFPEIAKPSPWVRFLRLAPWPKLAAAAAAALVFAFAIGGPFRQPKPPTPLASGWNVSTLAGTPRVGSKAVGINSPPGNLGIGQMLETDSRSRASINVDEIGRVDVEPDTRLRLLESAAGHKRLALDRGTIHATIWAPPGQFVVDTPSARAVDLGCIYMLQVDDSGAGLLRTTMGWVGFKLEGRESFTPAGAACPTRPKIGPGTPYFEDASQAFRTALSKLDFEGGTPAERRAQLAIILTQSRQRDALTLWHLLARVNDSERPAVYDRLAALVPPPPGITQAGILRLDQNMLDAWWNQLGLGNISLWRTWERSWSQRPSGTK